jgi:hypothetical protein
VHGQRQAESIAANRIALFGNRPGRRQLTNVTRMSEMIFEGGGVRHESGNGERPA